MLNQRCDNLDRFLNRELSAAQRAEFEFHVRICTACKTAVDADSRLQHVLKYASRTLEVVPPALQQRWQQRQTAVRSAPIVSGEGRLNHQKKSIAVLVALSVLAVLVVLTRSASVDDTSAPVAESDTEPEREVVSVTAVVESDSTAPRVVLSNDFIGLPVESDQANVTIVLVYPAHGRTSERAESLGPSVAGPQPAMVTASTFSSQNRANSETIQ